MKRTISLVGAIALAFGALAVGAAPAQAKSNERCKSTANMYTCFTTTYKKPIVHITLDRTALHNNTGKTQTYYCAAEQFAKVGARFSFGGKVSAGASFFKIAEASLESQYNVEFSAEISLNFKASTGGIKVPNGQKLVCTYGYEQIEIGGTSWSVNKGASSQYKTGTWKTVFPLERYLKTAIVKI